MTNDDRLLWTRDYRQRKRPMFRDRSGPNRAGLWWQETPFPLTKTEIDRLTINGVEESSLVFLQRVLKWRTINYSMLTLIIYGWIVMAIFFRGILSDHPRVIITGILLSVMFIAGLIESRF